MALSRKRRKELARLKHSAEDLWDEQLEALEHASAVLKDARRQAANYAREEVAPRVREGYETRVKPLASAARGRIAHDVIPSVTAGIGSALALLDAAKSPEVRRIVRSASSTTTALGSRAAARIAPPPPPRKGPGAGTYILIGLGVAAVASLAYAAWRTLSADDSLWVEDMEDTNPGEADLDDED